MTPANAYVLLTMEMPLKIDKMRWEFNTDAVRALMNYFTINQFASPPKMALLLHGARLHVQDNRLKNDIDTVLGDYYKQALMTSTPTAQQEEV